MPIAISTIPWETWALDWFVSCHGKVQLWCHVDTFGVIPLSAFFAFNSLFFSFLFFIQFSVSQKLEVFGRDSCKFCICSHRYICCFSCRRPCCKLDSYSHRVSYSKNAPQTPNRNYSQVLDTTFVWQRTTGFSLGIRIPSPRPHLLREPVGLLSLDVFWRDPSADGEDFLSYTMRC